MEPAPKPVGPSWTQWPPNCCETCEFWGTPDPYNIHQAICNNPTSVFSADFTDSRFRCEKFKRKAGDAKLG